jgi:hypothetical protein
MVKNSFTCNECGKSYLKKEDAIKCEEKHEEERRKLAEFVEKNKEMVFSKNVEVKKEDLENQFGGVKINFKDEHDLIILMGNKGGGHKPYRCLLPHHVYVRDIREAFEKEHFEVICVVGIKSSDVFPIAYKDGYGFQRWKDLESKDDALQEKNEVKE